MQVLPKHVPMIVLVLTATLSFSAQAAEVIYRWVDDFGVTHFASQPPEGVDYERVSGTRTPLSGPSPTLETGEADSDAPRREASQTRRAIDALPEQCEQARSNLALLAGGGPVMLRNEDGEEILLEGEARLAFAEQNQAFIDEWC